MKKLTVCGKLTLFLEDRNGSFDSLGRLESLEKLNLINTVFPDPPSEGALHAPLHALPPAYKFPNKLRSLTLSGTLLDWVHMSVLGSLENLEVLKLKDKAFMGMSWNSSDGVFPNLGRTDLVVWSASHDQFPRLKYLQLRNCLYLMEIPFCLADVTNFQVLDLCRSERAAESAKKIAHKKEEGQQSGNLHEFKLNIYEY